MTFEQSYVLFAIVPFLLLFIFLWKLERRRRLVVSSHEMGHPNTLLRIFTRRTPKYFWFLAALLALLALAGPTRQVSKDGIEVQGRIKCISLDLSQSMRSIYRSKTGRSSVEVIKEVTLPFVEKRSATDYIAVTVYGGKFPDPDGGDATILVRPTQNAEFVKQQIKKINPGMVGVYTSIGEGIFTCLSAMLEQEFENHKVDRFRLREGLEKKNFEYPTIAARKIGHMKNMVIVLFTDGVNNAGIDPITMIEFSRMVGIKMYFSVLESTGSTGAGSLEEEARRRNALRNAIRSTGGFDFETKIAEDVEKHYESIDKFESAKIRIVPQSSSEKLWREWLWWAIVLLLCFVVIEIVFLKLP